MKRCYVAQMQQRAHGVFFFPYLQMDPKRFDSRTIPSESEDQDFSGSDDDSERKSVSIQHVCSMFSGQMPKFFYKGAVHPRAAVSHRDRCILTFVLLCSKLWAITRRYRAWWFCLLSNSTGFLFILWLR